jgi:hypothetical protein
VTSGATTTAQLAGEFDPADAALNDEMDNIVAQFADANATFVADYKNARIIVDLAAAKAKVKKPTSSP